MALLPPVFPILPLHRHSHHVPTRTLTPKPPRSLPQLSSAIHHLERTICDPAEAVSTLSSRELQLVLVYFSREGKDSYCALEVFDLLRRENRVDGEIVEVMVGIVCGWVGRLIGGDCGVEEVVGLLDEMECVGLDPGFSMVEKVVCLYWERGRREEAVEFVRVVVERGGVGGGESDRRIGGPVGYLAWKMMMDGSYMDAAKLVINFKECGLKPEVYSYLIAITALVKEQKEFSKSLRRIMGSAKSGSIAELDEQGLAQIASYQSDILKKATCLSKWAFQEGDSSISGLIHERLLALYTCAGSGVDAERQLWQLKLCGKEPDNDIYDIVLAICASQNETHAVSRLLAGMGATSAGRKKKTLSWLLRGYLKGGYYTKACEMLETMLELGLHPDYLDRVGVLQGMRKSIQESGDVEPYLRICKRLSDMELVGPCLVYLHMKSHKLWVMKMI